jgi:hypothetical protein
MTCTNCKGGPRHGVSTLVRVSARPTFGGTRPRPPTQGGRTGRVPASYIESQVLDRTLLISRQITPFATKLLFVSPRQSWDLQ